MSQNLITAGVIDPRQLPLDRVRQQVATFLKVSLNQIDRIECWKHQIWVKLVESRAKFISYRSLPLWIDQGLAVISRCTSRPSLDQLGEILRSEREWYDQHEMPQAVQLWREAWAQQAQPPAGRRRTPQTHSRSSASGSGVVSCLATSVARLP